MQKLLDSTVSEYRSLEGHLIRPQGSNPPIKKPVNYSLKKGRRITFLMRTLTEAEEARIPLLQRGIR